MFYNYYTMRNDEAPAPSGAEKLEKICKAFPLLSEEKQDYILGILQALVFAHNAEQPRNQDDPKDSAEPR
jgi:hypothetical protein